MSSASDFGTLVETYSARIFAYLWRLLRDSLDAEDCLQETFLRAYRAYPRLAVDSNHQAWLYKIATNTAYSYLRRRARAAAYAAELDPQLPHDGLSPSEEVQRRDTLAAIVQAVEDLPYKQRSALIMRKYQELSYAEISHALGCSEGAARANVYQALQKLRAQFGAVAESEEDGP